MAKVAAVAEHTFAGLTCSEIADLAPAFVLGALPPTEADAIRRHLADCPELHAEVAELNSVVPALSIAAEAVAPSAALKDRIMAAAAADLEARRSANRRAAASTPAAAPTRAPAPSPTTPTATDAARRTGWDLGALFRRPVWAGVAAAALIAAVALGAWNVQLRDQLAGLEAYRTGVIGVLDAAAKPGAQIAVLASDAGSAGPTGLAAVAADGSVAMVMRDLTPTTGTQVYEAWVIVAGQVPVPIGDFQVGAGGAASLRTAQAPVANGVTVALTLEPQKGATAPTLPIRAAGVARPQPG
jgi:anti-sigma-K factor RskA